MTEVFAAPIDPALPGWPVLMSEELLAQWLWTHTGRSLLSRRYLRYKPQTSCIVAVETDAGPGFIVGATAHSQAKLAKYRPGSRQIAPVIDANLLMLFATQDSDRQIPAIAQPTKAISRSRKGYVYREAQISTLAYKPGRRWVAQIEDPSCSPWLLRSYRKGVQAVAGQRMRAFQAAPVWTPTVLGKSDRYASLAVEYLPGRPAGATDLAALGRSLASLHEWQASAAMLRCPTLPWQESVELATYLRPNLGSRLERVASALGAFVSNADVLVPSHGDLRLDQIVIGADGKVGMLDLDRSGLAPPARDLASISGRLSKDVTSDDLLDGYSQIRPVPSDLDRFVAMDAMASITQPFRAFNRDWPQVMEQSLSTVEEILF